MATQTADGGNVVFHPPPPSRTPSIHLWAHIYRSIRSIIYIVVDQTRDLPKIFDFWFPYSPFNPTKFAILNPKKGCKLKQTKQCDFEPVGQIIGGGTI